VDKIFRVDPAAEEDSDRPEWAGVKGGKAGGGGKPFGAGTKKGDLFGDMYILLRDPNGVPLTDANGEELVVAFYYDTTGVLVPVTDADGQLVAIPRNEEGDLLTSVTVGETTYDVVPGEVELGRLSVGRSPSKVLNHSLDEALAKLTAEGAVIAIDSTGRLAVDGTTIDSPLENLALYETYMTTGTIPGVTLPDGFSPAALLAAAGDKTGTISVDTLCLHELDPGHQFRNDVLRLLRLPVRPHRDLVRRHRHRAGAGRGRSGGPGGRCLPADPGEPVRRRVRQHRLERSDQ